MGRQSNASADVGSGMDTVVIDARMVTPIPHGFARYVTRLAEGLKLLREAGQLNYEVVFFTHGETANISRVFRDFKTIPVHAPFLNPLEIIELPFLLKRAKASIYHSPTFSSLPFCPCPWLVTVHDLNHLLFGHFKEHLYYKYILRPFVLRAKKCITVSEFSRKELANWTGTPLSSIAIAYNAMPREMGEWLKQDIPEARKEADKAVLNKYGLQEKRYFLCLSNLKPHKNIKTLVSAFLEYRLEYKAGGDWELVLSVSEADLVSQFNVPVAGIRAIGGVENTVGLALLRGAGGVTFPSSYEGFGLPPVEAAALGVPLIVSKIPPHEEGLQDLSAEEVSWVKPEDVSGWAHAMLALTKRTLEGSVFPISLESRSKVLARYDILALGRKMDEIYREALK